MTFVAAGVETSPGRRAARIAVIGCGWWATRAHLPALARHPDATIAAIVDPDAGNRARAAERFEVPSERSFADATDMYASVELDGAIVAAPHALHARIAEGALERGLHVLLEKPMTIRSDEARSLHELAGARSVELIIGYPWHYNAHVAALRAAIGAGRIGRLELVAGHYVAKSRALYRGQPDLLPELGYPLHAPAPATYSDPAIAGGGQGVTQTTHALALMLWLTGLRAESVVAITENHELDVDLVDGMVIGFEGGAIGTLASSGSLLHARDERMELRVYGDQGHVTMDLSAGHAAIIAIDGEVDQLEVLPPPQRSPEWAPADNLVEVVLGRAVNRSPSELGWRTVELVEAMYRSSREGRRILLG